MIVCHGSFGFDLHLRIDDDGQIELHSYINDWTRYLGCLQPEQARYLAGKLVDLANNADAEARTFLDGDRAHMHDLGFDYTGRATASVADDIIPNVFGREFEME